MSPIDQRSLALKRANEVRTSRARIKNHIRTGELTVTDAIEKYKTLCGPMPVGELVKAQAGWGPHRTFRFFLSLNVSPLKRIGTLSDRQRLSIEAAIRKGGPHFD